MSTQRTETDTNETAISANVRAELARAGMSRAGLAHRAHLSEPQLNRRLRGDARFTAGELQRIAEALGVPATALLDYRAPITTRGGTR